MMSKRMIVVGIGLACYFAVFFGTSVSGVPRWVFISLFLLPEELAQPWFGSPPQFALLDRLPVALLAAGMLLVSGAAGWLVLRLMGWERLLITRLERVVYALAVGLSVVSTFVLFAGLAGWLYRGLFVGAGLAVVVAVSGLAWRARRAGRTSVRWQAANGSEPVLVRDPLPRRLAWIAAPFVAVILLGGMLPPIEFDVREYHLQAPKEFYLAGPVMFLPHNVYANMPLGAEMFSLLGMVLAGDWWWGALAGKTVTACFVPLTGLAIYCTGRRLVSPLAGVVGAVVYVSTAWMIQVSASGLVDGVLAAYLFLAVDATVLLRRTPLGADPRVDRSQWPLAGFLAGSAAAVKYPGILFVVVPLVVWAAWRSWASRGSAPVRHWLRPLAVLVVAVVVACGGWLGKNALLAGNPTYPLLYSIFGGESWNAEKDAQWNRVHRPHDFRPQTLASDLARVGWRSEWLSPLLYPLAALAFLVPSQRRTAGLLAGYFALVIAVWWLFTHRIDRFWIPALPVVAVLAGIGATWSEDRRWRAALVTILLAGSAFNLLVATSGPGGYNRYFVALDDLRRDPERVDPWHLLLNREAADGKVLTVGDAEVFDLTMPVLYSTCFDTNPLEKMAAGRTPEEVGQALRQAGITHVYVAWNEIARYRQPGNYGFTDFFQPELFDQWVAAGVLKPLPSLPDHPGRAYRVVGSRVTT